MASDGLFSGILKQANLTGLSTQPTMKDNEFVIDITQDEFQQLATQNVPASTRGNVKLELHEGKLTVRVKLF